MKNLIIRKVFDKSKKYKLLDNKDIVDLISLLDNYHFIGEFISVSKSDFMMAINYSNKTFLVDRVNLEQEISRIIPKHSDLFFEYLLSNFLILKIILHEISHSTQFMLSESNFTNFDTMFMKLAYDGYKRMEDNNFDNENDIIVFNFKSELDKQVIINELVNYDVSLAEHMADFDGNLELLSILKEFNNTGVTSFYKTKFIVDILKKYHLTNNNIYKNYIKSLPIEYVKSFVPIINGSNFELVNNNILLNFKDRLRYGFPMNYSSEEFIDKINEHVL